MTIYKSESDIQERIFASKTVAISVPIALTSEKTDLFINSLEQIKKSGSNNKILAKITLDKHPDLMYGSAILASTVMNKNDDVFLPGETWKARYTPINTPFNDNHIAYDIIGHIIASRILDENGNEIDDSTDEQDLPNYFDVCVDFVVYKDIFPKIAEDIAEKAPAGKKFVSMEAALSNFDYALIDQNNDMKIVGRNEKTAFLTKYLRAYGGSGVYSNYRIARVLRNFRFIGMGSVDDPANPASEYTSLSNVNVEEGIELNSLSKVLLYVTKGKVMTIETLEQAKELINTLETENMQLKAKVAEFDTVKANLDTITPERDSLKEELTVVKSQVDIAKAEIETLKTKVTELETGKTELEAKLSEANTKLNEYKSNEVTQSRVTTLKDLNVDVTEDQVTRLASMTDEAFASIVEFTKTIKPQANKEDSTDSAEKKAAEQLDQTKAEDNTDVTNIAGDDVELEPTIATVAEKLVASLKSYNKTTKRNLRNKKVD